MDAEAVWGNHLRELNQRLSSTDDYALMVRFIEQFLLDCVQKSKRPTHPIDTVSEFIRRQPDRIGLVELCDQACLSPSQLERKFVQRLGITPKLLSRIARFDQVCRLKETRPDLDWLSIALYCGYHDYQHLVKDCKAFAGMTPGSYWSEENRAPERNITTLDRTAIPLHLL